MLTNARITALLTLCIVSPLLAQGPDGSTAQPYAINLDSELTMTVQGVEQKIDADTTVKYTHWTKGSEKTIGFDQIGVIVNMDDKPTMNTLMSKDKLVTVQNGNRSEVLAENAPDQLKSMLQDSFGIPICKLSLDENGNVVKKEMLKENGASPVASEDMVANAMLFHPSYSADDASWDSETRMGMGNGGFVTGDLTYTRGTPNGESIPFTVKGDLSKESIQMPNVPFILKDVVYKVTGTQTYDSKTKQWQDGKFNIDISYQMNIQGKDLGGAKGTIVATMKTVDPSAADSNPVVESPPEVLK